MNVLTRKQAGNARFAGGISSADTARCFDIYFVLFPGQKAVVTTVFYGFLGELWPGILTRISLKYVLTSNIFHIGKQIQ